LKASGGKGKRKGKKKKDFFSSASDSEDELRKAKKNTPGKKMKEKKLFE
jgi:hypothetical protein